MKKLLILVVFILEIILCVFTKEITKEFVLTLNICLYSLMPTLFFQIIFSNILINSDLYKLIPEKLCNIFNITRYEGSIVLISMFSGYPNNIKLLKDSKNEYLLYTTNYVNPLYLIGTVGNVYLNNIRIIILVYLSHILSNILLLYLFRNKHIKDDYKSYNSNNLYSESLNTSIKTISIIFSNILFISLFISITKLTIPFNSFIIGLIEFSKGIYEISLLNISIYLKGLLILIIITFGSLSIHFQSISINNKIKYIKYLLFRLLNVFISIIIYFLLAFINVKVLI